MSEIWTVSRPFAGDEVVADVLAASPERSLLTLSEEPPRSGRSGSKMLEFDLHVFTPPVMTIGVCNPELKQFGKTRFTDGLRVRQITY